MFSIHYSLDEEVKRLKSENKNYEEGRQRFASEIQELRKTMERDTTNLRAQHETDLQKAISQATSRLEKQLEEEKRLRSDAEKKAQQQAGKSSDEEELKELKASIEKAKSRRQQKKEAQKKQQQQLEMKSKEFEAKNSYLEQQLKEAESRQKQAEKVAQELALSSQAKSSGGPSIADLMSEVEQLQSKLREADQSRKAAERDLDRTKKDLERELNYTKNDLERAKKELEQHIANAASADLSAYEPEVVIPAAPPG